VLSLTIIFVNAWNFVVLFFMGFVLGCWCATRLLATDATGIAKMMQALGRNYVGYITRLR
jgi:hypothetical protein